MNEIRTTVRFYAHNFYGIKTESFPKTGLKFVFIRLFSKETYAITTVLKFDRPKQRATRLSRHIRMNPIMMGQLESNY